MTEFIGVGPEEPVYRIFALPSFKEMLRQGKLSLLSPEYWDDRFEVLPRRTFFTIDRSPDHWFWFEKHLVPAYAQCWSRSSQCDVLMRAYSRVVNLRTRRECASKRNICPEEEGVRVRSTPQKLMQALEHGCPPKSACFIGAVEYHEPEFIKSRLSEKAEEIVKQAKADSEEAIETSATGVLGELKTSAELLLLKRKAFEQEAEVRVILVSPFEFEKNIIHIPFEHDKRIDPNELFDQVSFDPRLLDFELQERRDCAQKLGYTGNFDDSDLYKFTWDFIRVVQG
jgi:hypothetical protein